MPVAVLDRLRPHLHSLSAFEQTGDYDFKSKVLYALSGLYRTTGNASQADDVLRRIVKEFPLSPITVEAKKELNLPVEEVFSDASDSLYNYSENKFFNSDFTSALEGYRQLLNLYPTSIHAEKVKYSVGWLYENVFYKPDSSYMFYSQVISSNPKSEYSKAVQKKIKEYDDGKNKPVIDTTKIDTSKITPIKTDSTQIDPSKSIDTSKTGNDINKIEVIKKDEAPVILDEAPKQKDPSDLKKPDDNKPEETSPTNIDPDIKK